MSRTLAPLVAHYHAIIRDIGEDTSREGLLDTPTRAAKAMLDMTSGYQQTAQDVVGDALFDSDNEDMVIVRNIEFYSLCEHHILPFFGTVDIAYIPSGKVLGLSKLARIVDVFAKRLQIQENFTKQIATAIADITGAKGVMVVSEAKHMCMMMRGVEKQCSTTHCTNSTGIFLAQPELRKEFLAHIRN